MQVREVMTRGVETIPPHCTLQEAAALMRARNVGALPVADGRLLVGMLTDRDIAVRATAEGHDAFEDRVRDAMTPGVVACSEEQDVREAARLMQERRVRRLVVLDRAHEPAGIVALEDLAAGDERLAGETLERVSGGQKRPGTAPR
jgi:CBS domain-containing protein